MIAEVVETPRIPPTTDILGSYAVRLTADGQLRDYRRLRRYRRNQTFELESL